MFYNTEEGGICLDDADLCINCVNLKECPLTNALAASIVSLPDPIIVEKCASFRQKERHLKLVSNSIEAEESEERSADNTSFQFDGICSFAGPTTGITDLGEYRRTRKSIGTPPSTES